MSGAVSKVLGNLTYEDIVQRETQRAEYLHNAGMQEIATCINLSLDGGECLICGKPWKRIDVDNEFAKFSYFQPDCKCYPVCKMGKMIDGEFRVSLERHGCGRVMYEEFYGTRKVRSRVKNKQEEIRLFLVCTHCGSWVPQSDWEVKVQR